MKSTIYLLALLSVFMLSNCTTYYYSTVQSYENQLPQNEDGSFSNEREDIVITYSFQNENGDLVYDIINNTDDPYMVDWERSVLVLEDNIMPIKSDRARFEGDMRTTTYLFGENSSYGSGSISGTITLPQNKLFITPHSKVAYSPIALMGTVFNWDVIKKTFRKIKAVNKEVEQLSFQEHNTPLKFKSYITLINDADKTQTVFEDTFYISDYYHSRTFKTFDENALKRGNTFYIQETKGSGALLYGTLGALVVAAIVFGEPEAPVIE